MIRSSLLFLLIFLFMSPACKSQAEIPEIVSDDEEQVPQKMDLFLLIGQSNMAGRATIEEGDRDSLDCVFLFTGNAGDEWEKAANPLNKYSTVRKDIKMQKLGPGYTFARQMTSYFPERKIGLVVNARGASTLNEWLPGTQYYREALKRVKMAMNDGDLKGVVWHQGEGDVNRTGTYIERIRILITALREDTGVSDLPFVAGQLSEDRVRRIPFNQMIVHLPEMIEMTGVATTEGTTTFDSTHFDTRSQRILGERYAAEMKRLLEKD